MLIGTFPVGMLATNCYVVNCEETCEAIIIDPGFDVISEADPVISYVDRGKLKVKFIVNTHGHSDHVNGDAHLHKKYGVPVCIHSFDAYFLEPWKQIFSPILLRDSEEIKFGKESLKVLHTPGHTHGSVCLVSDKLVFSGDALFAGSIGRTDFPESSWPDMRVSLKKLYGLPGRLLVYPGHGEVTVLGEEKRFNLFLCDL
jgi:hydroxyacylglutathione hydrolase